MSWLRKLLGIDAGASSVLNPESQFDPKPAPAPASVGANRIVIKRYGGHTVSVRSLDFTGQITESPNKRFTLLWQDRMSVDGAIRSGRYILIDDGRVAVDKRMSRPQDGKVANDGTFVLNDWGASDELSGTLRAFASDGCEIISRSFSANLLNNGLSADGRLAVSQTCNAPGSPDSSVLCVFDLAQGREIACWRPEAGWALDYEFPGGDRIRMIRRTGIPVDYSFDGDFLDRHAWYADEVARGNYYVIKDAREAGESVTGLGLETLREGTIVAISNPDDRWKAPSFRLLGEIEEQAGDERSALDAFRQALAIDPKVGVAKKAATLAKRLGC